jgi:hypothetical protein
MTTLKFELLQDCCLLGKYTNNFSFLDDISIFLISDVPMTLIASHEFAMAKSKHRDKLLTSFKPLTSIKLYHIP